MWRIAFAMRSAMERSSVPRLMLYAMSGARAPTAVAQEREDGAVVVAVGGRVEEEDARRRCEGGLLQLLDDVVATTLADVRYALDQRAHAHPPREKRTDRNRPTLTLGRTRLYADH